VEDIQAATSQQLRHALLSSAEEQEWGRQLKGSDKEQRLAAAHFFQANQRLVMKIAYQYRGRGLELEDLSQEGNFGLWKAITRFEHERGLKFSTYATWWVRQAITRAIEKQGRNIRLPAHIIEKVGKMRKVQAALGEGLSREPTHAELAAAMKLETKEVKYLLKVSFSTTSIDEQHYGKNEEASLADFLAAPGNLEEEVESSLASAEIRAMLAELPPRTRLVIAYRFGLFGLPESSLQEIGIQLRVSRERVRQIEAEGMDQLRAVSATRPELAGLLGSGPNAQAQAHPAERKRGRPKRSQVASQL